MSCSEQRRGGQREGVIGRGGQIGLRRERIREALPCFIPHSPSQARSAIMASLGLALAN